MSGWRLITSGIDGADSEIDQVILIIIIRRHRLLRLCRLLFRTKQLKLTATAVNTGSDSLRPAQLKVEPSAGAVAAVVFEVGRREDSFAHVSVVAYHTRQRLRDASEERLEQPHVVVL